MVLITIYLKSASMFVPLLLLATLLDGVQLYELERIQNASSTVEAWASIRSKFSLRVVRLGLALERNLAHKCVEKYYFFTFIVALAQRSYLIHESE